MSHQSLVTPVGARSKSLLVIWDFTRVVTLQMTHIRGGQVGRVSCRVKRVWKSVNFLCPCHGGPRNAGGTVV